MSALQTPDMDYYATKEKLTEAAIHHGLILALESFVICAGFWKVHGRTSTWHVEFGLKDYKKYTELRQERGRTVSVTKWT